ncbi:MAG TPA: nucleotide sugar dehydrogenase [Candidatus Eisenbacteria bacterium]|jgi:GDP-mannose 6-dehydrogenase|nr:nucleotide sugar dehydrogenase [Candidatus Eisenbacteria bacterium]
MNISIFGLGYVGAVTAGCLSRQGHSIVGVDVHPQKVESFNEGVPPIIEPGLEELLKQAKARGLLRATLKCAEAISATDLSIVCVGTPSTVTGALDLRYVRQVLKEIAVAVRRKSRAHALVLRSTMLPGSTARLVSELLADLEAGGLLRIFYYPEFLRESTAVADFENPSLAVVGTRKGEPPPGELMRQLFGEQSAVVNWQTAEMVKYACNTFHATKIAFANEIGRVSKPMGIDSLVVMELLCRDRKLNLSPYYLKPGNPFGGSCLPKDVRALATHARTHGLNLPALESLLPSNERHLQSLLGLILDSGQSEVAILGLSFKLETDDLRESAMVEVAQTLLGRGYKVRIYDPALNLAALVGSNKRVIDTKMPHLASLLNTNLGEAIGQEGLVVAAQKCAPIAELKKFITPRHQVLDVNGWEELRGLAAKYVGFCW